MEQYFQAMKAHTFGDRGAQSRCMLDTTGPKAAKEYGREVANYDESVWVAKREAVMRRGLFAKFQNPLLKGCLRATGKRAIYEVRHDPVWGTNTSMGDLNPENLSKSTGKNLLGKLLVDIRDSFPPTDPIPAVPKATYTKYRVPITKFLTIAHEDIFQIIEHHMFKGAMVHQCNTRTVSSKGLASRVFELYPAANVYQSRAGKAVGIDDIKAGDYTRHGKIINLYGQKSPGPCKKDMTETPTDRLAWFKSGLEKICNSWERSHTLVIPAYIGCVLAGGSWVEYFKAIVEIITTKQVTCIIACHPARVLLKNFLIQTNIAKHNA